MKEFFEFFWSPLLPSVCFTADSEYPEFNEHMGRRFKVVKVSSQKEADELIVKAIRSGKKRDDLYADFTIRESGDPELPDFSVSES